MMMPRLALAAAVLLVASAAAAEGLEGPLFMGLGDLPGGIFVSRARAVSADGTTVVGESVAWEGEPIVGPPFHPHPGRYAFRWTLGDGMEALVGDNPEATATSVSGDGSVVGGGSFAAVPVDYASTFDWGFWDPFGDFTDLDLSRVSDVSADGSVVVGGAAASTAYRWTGETGVVSMGPFTANALSGDGSIAVGVRNRLPVIIIGGPEQPYGIEAVRWTAEDGIVGLGDLDGGLELSSMAHGVSGDGRVIVGDSLDEAFRWTAEEGMVGLDDLEGGEFASRAVAASWNGAVIVGWGTDEDGKVPIVWDATHGMRRVDEVLTGLGIDLTGWELTTAADVSADGRTLVGTGQNPDGNVEAWLAALPPWVIDVGIDIRPWSDYNAIDLLKPGVIPVALLGSDTLDMTDVDVTTLAFGPSGAAPAFDLTNPWVFFFSHWDVDDDGEPDLLSYYRTEETGIGMGDAQACLTGEMLDGTAFRGCDAIMTVPPCGHGFEAVFVLPPLVWFGGRLRRRRWARPTAREPKA